MHAILGDMLNKKHLPRGPLPQNAVYIGRPSVWGNPFPVGYSHPEGDPRRVYRTRSEAIAAYRSWLWRQLQRDPQFLAPLVGRDLVCWCAPLPCHAEVLQKALIWRYGSGAPVAAAPPAPELVIAVTGSREYPTPANIRIVIERVARANPGARLLHGDARGADRIAAGYAAACGLAVEAMPADWATHPRSAGFIRNEAMIVKAQRLLAFWDGQSRGTAHALEVARKWGIPTEIYGPEQLPELCESKQLPPPAEPSDGPAIPPAIVTRSAPYQPQRRARREWWDAELGDSADQAPDFHTNDIMPEVLDGEYDRWQHQQDRASDQAASQARQDISADAELGEGVSLAMPVKVPFTTSRMRRPAKRSRAS